jgi:sugar-specific transcriptional regulator TrmB
MEILDKINLTQYQKKVIKTLLKNNQLNANQISKLTKIAPNKVYQTINELTDKNIISSANTTPKIYTLINFDSYLKNQIKKKQKEISNLEYEYEDFIKTYNNQNKDEEFWYLESINSLIHKIEPIMQNLQEENIGMIEEWSSRYSLLKIAKQKIKKGKSIKFIGNINKNNIYHVKKWIEIGAKIKHNNKTSKAGYGVFDNKHVKISLKYNQLKSIWIENKYLASILKEHFENIWEKSKEITLDNIEEFNK